MEYKCLKLVSFSAGDIAPLIYQTGLTQELSKISLESGVENENRVENANNTGLTQQIEVTSLKENSTNGSG